LGRVLQWLPGLFNVLLVAGAAYLVWIGIAVWRSGLSTQTPPAGVVNSHAATFRQGLLTSVMNPKAYVFTLAVFPQFMRPGERPLALQFLLMGLIVWAVQAGIYGPLALAAGRAGRSLAARPRLQ